VTAESLDCPRFSGLPYGKGDGDDYLNCLGQEEYERFVDAIWQPKRCLPGISKRWYTLRGACPWRRWPSGVVKRSALDP